MLEAVNLTKVYDGEIRALNQLNLKVIGGEIFCLLGANGAGKTTAINLMLNFFDPTEGTVLINGIDITKNPLEAKKYVSYLSENVMMYSNFTALQNLDFFTKIAGKRDGKRDEYIACLQRVGLPENSFNMRIRKFSKGMRQRLGIAVVIMKDAPVVILDEPTSGLDPQGAADFVELLRSLRDEGKAIFMSTHDVFRAKEVADRVGIMQTGSLIMVKTKEELGQVDLEQIYLEYIND